MENSQKLAGAEYQTGGILPGKSKNIQLNQ
jgi:hypothetical protein